MAKYLMKGNEALCEGAIRAGCRAYFGYPITPQNEVPEYMSRRMPEAGGVFLQTESEVATINMLLGANAAGMRSMTSSSSPGISLMQEGISYMAGSETPAVIVNIVRGSPGLGNIAPSQGDYFQAVKGGGNGDYWMVVYGPSSVQELTYHTYKAFDIAYKYRNPVLILADGVLGQMMEPVDFDSMPDIKTEIPEWAAIGLRGRKEPNIINSIHLKPEVLEAHCFHLMEKMMKAKEEVLEYEEYMVDDADIVIVAYGVCSRVGRSGVQILRSEGIKAGMLRPITLWPYPEKQLRKLAENPKRQFLTLELSSGQMLEDVRLGVQDDKRVHFYGRMGGVLITKEEVVEQVKRILKR
jgi:2-oxoglutarate/2-oxoacid ferredoxin oxidoreductase subunit alpha